VPAARSGAGTLRAAWRAADVGITARANYVR
jgi:hypothetical protein